MNKNTVYILQKDCLDAKAGDEFEFSESSDCYSKIGGDCQIDYLSALFVENNPEWFKPKEEVNESKPIEPIRHVYNSLEFETNDGEKLWLCMRDSGYEIKYKETWWEFKKGEVLARANKPSVSRIKSPYKDKNGNQIYSGDTVKGVNKHIGQSEVFFGYGVWQPFDYLNDYDGSNYEIVAPEKLSTANTEQFKWDDKLAMELCEFVGMRVGKGIDIRQQVELLTEVFKQSKSKKEEPQWEILSFKNLRSGIVYVKKDNGKFNSGNGLDWDLEKFDIKDHEIINSVKRFPDNTVWSVDDDTQHGKITAFKITGNTMIAEIKHNAFPYYPFYLSELKAPKEEQVPIKVYALHYYGGEPNYHNHTLICSERIPVEKYDALKKLIQDFLNSPLGEIINYEQYKARKYTESELLQARRDAFFWARTYIDNYGGTGHYKSLKFQTVEDYINSLK